MRTVGKAVANKEPRLAHFRPAKELLNKARLANAGFPEMPTQIRAARLAL